MKQSCKSIIENQFKMFDNMLEGVSVYKLIFNNNGKVIDGILEYVNHATVETMNIHPEKVIGKKASEIVKSDVNKAYLKVINEFIVTGEYKRLGIYYPPTNRHFIISGFNMPNNYFAILRVDITEQKEAEEKLKESHTNLELKVQERTAELDMLIKELKSSNDELQKFAYIASHDLQEPLRTISNFTQLIERRYKGKLDQDADEFIDYIIDATKRMQQLIRDLLRYSRVTSQQEDFKLVNTEKVVKQLISDLQVTFKENNVKITCNSLPEVCADERQLIQLFQNLISNAIKYRKPEEPPKIHISAKKEDNECVFSVSDNGIGIESEYFDRIFAIFQRLHTKEEYEGSGIGLSIVKKIIDRHGGQIWVESELGNGSTFYFTIPLITCH
ncbi:ATP-binding protein [Methanobacterium sp.]|uniref:PAS domain-containing sensor histidine kinase n=1 Tax=Methanobacterium sp. TaxID=2164 RepID=UPI003C764D12